MNGAVERCNGAWRYEFYQTYELPSGVNELNPILDSYQHLYNHYRPHGALAGNTPAQYLAHHSATRPQPSQLIPDSPLATAPRRDYGRIAAAGAARSGRSIP